MRFGERKKNTLQGVLTLVDYEYKSAVLRSGLCDIRRKVDYAFFLSSTDTSSPFSIPIDEARALFDWYGDTEEWLEAGKINRAFYQRVKRLKARVSDIISQPSIFLTLTFNDDILASTSPQTRRRYVSRYLRDNFPVYVANVDFGALNGREHYHAIIQSQNVNYDMWHKNGAIKGEKIVVDNIAALSKYVSKLTNHAIKETCRRCALIYSR